MSDILKRYLDQEFTPKTKRYYTSLLNCFENYLVDKGKNIHNFEVIDLQSYYKSKIQSGSWTSNSSAATFIIVLQRFARWLLEETDATMIGKRGNKLDVILRERVRLTNIIRMKKPKVVQKIKTGQPVSTKQLLKLFRIQLNDRKDPNHYNFRRTWAITWFGCRVGELVEIEPRMIDVDDNSLHFITEKTTVERMNYYDDFTREIIIEEYLRNNQLLNITEVRYWQCMSKYSEKMDAKIMTKLGREAYNTNMASVSKHPKLEKKYKGKIDDNYIKIISGHSITGLKDISVLYKVYPLEMIKDVMINYHYLRPLEKEIKKLF